MQYVGAAPTDPADLTTKAYVDTAVAGAGGGFAHTVSVVVDFGGASSLAQETTAMTAAWTTTSTPAVVVLAGVNNADHVGEESAIEQVSAMIYNRVPGVSFDVVAYAPTGTWGRHSFLVMG